MSPMRDRIVLVMRRTWDQIGTDIIEMSSGYVDRAEVIESVLDAGRMGDYGGDKEAYRAAKGMKMDELHSIGLEAFSFEDYGY